MRVIQSPRRLLHQRLPVALQHAVLNNARCTCRYANFALLDSGSDGSKMGGQASTQAGASRRLPSVREEVVAKVSCDGTAFTPSRAIALLRDGSPTEAAALVDWMADPIVHRTNEPAARSTGAVLHALRS